MSHSILLFTKACWDKDLRQHMTYSQMGGRGVSLALFFILLLLASACREPTSVSKDVLTGLDQLTPIYTDTLTLRTVTDRDDSLNTSRQLLHYIGSMEDPAIGKTYGALFAQVRLPSNNIDLGDSLRLDSLVLHLRYARPYGKGEVPQSFTVYRLSEDMDPLSPQQEYTAFTFDPVPLGTAQVVAAAADTVRINIRLTDVLGDTLLGLSGGDIFENNDTWLPYFKGLLIAPDTASGYGEALYPINTLDALTNLTVYYASGSEDSLRFVFPINATSATHNYYKHQYSEPTIVQQLTKQVAVDSVVYAQGLGGLLTAIDIPNIRSLGDITIMKAALVITQRALPTDSIFGPPANLTLRVRSTDTAGTVFQTLFDEGYSDQQVFYDFGGSREETLVSGTTYYRYTFNLLRHLQFVVDNRLDNLPLLLKVLPSSTVPDRLSMGGGQHPDDNLRMKLHLYYTQK